MSAWLLLIAWVWPLLLAVPASGVRFRQDWAAPGAPDEPSLARGARRRSLPWAALGPVPALLAVVLVPIGTELPMPWFFLGTQLGLDATARVYLGFTAVLWLAAGVYTAYGERGAAGSAGRFDALFLLAMAGNLWLIVAQDLFGFYAGFAMMGLASYGLVVHDGSASALRAGKVYLVMALLGEVTLFAGLVLLATEAGTTLPAPGDVTGLSGLTITLLLLGLGVKAGMVPLHLWLPLAHPAAPIAASAVLSGTMIKVALLGWIRFLPVGALALPDWGHGLALAGLATMTLALPVGIVQKDPKVILAYSSIAKMGFLMLALGLTLVQPALAPVGVAGIALYAAQHGLAKGGLFLGVGLRKHAGSPGSPAGPWVQPLILGVLVFLALALAGAPFTSGAVAKYNLKPVLDAAEWTWLGGAVAVSAVGTTLLMARFVWVAARTAPHEEPGWAWPLAAWGLLFVLVALFPFAFGKPAGWLSNAGPVGLAIGIAAAATLVAALRPQLPAPFVGLVPPGDLLALMTPLLDAFRQSGETLLADIGRGWARAQGLTADTFERVFGRPAADVERGLREWPMAGALWVGITTLLLLLLFAGSPPVAPTTATVGTTDQPASAAAARVGSMQKPDAPVPAPALAPEPAADQPLPPMAEEPPSAAAPGTGTATDRPGSASPDAVRPTEEDSVAATLPPPGRTPPDRTHPADAASPPPEPESMPAAQAPSAPEAVPEPVPALPAQPVPGSAREPLAKDATQPAREAVPAHPGTASGPESAGTAPCDPPRPYRFAVAGGAAIELRHCTADGEKLAAPEPTRGLVWRVQQGLAASGLNPGPVDGLLGPRTRAAIADYRRAHGLPAAGGIDFELLDALQREPVQD